MNPKKLRPVDWALGYPFVPEQIIDPGCKLEPAVFLHWRRQREDLAYLSAKSQPWSGQPERHQKLRESWWCTKSRAASHQRESRSSRHGGICSASGSLSVRPADELKLHGISSYPIYTTPLQIEPCPVRSGRRSRRFKSCHPDHCLGGPRPRSFQSQRSSLDLSSTLLGHLH